MASRRPSCGSSAAVVALMLVVTSAFLASFEGSGIGHVLSTKEEARDFEEFEVKSGEFTDEMAGTGKEAQEGLESWAEWAKEKLSEGLGFKHSDAKEAAKRTDAAGEAGNLKDVATEKVEEAKRAVGEKASELKDSTLKKADEMKNAAKEKAEHIREVACKTTGEVKEKAEEAKEARQSGEEDKASEKEEEVRERAAREVEAAEEGWRKEAEEGDGEHLRWAKENAQERIEAAKSKAGEVAGSAKEKIKKSLGCSHGSCRSYDEEL